MSEQRVFIPGCVYELVTVTLKQRRFLAPTASIQGILRGLLVDVSRARGIRLHAYAVMGTHLHLLVTPDDPRAIPAIMQDFKSISAKRINMEMRRRGSIWQPSYTPDLLTIEPAVQLSRLRYVLRHGQKEGLVQNPCDSPYLNAVRVLLDPTCSEGRGMILHPLPVMAGAPPEVQRACLIELLRTDLSDEDAVSAAWQVLARAGRRAGDELVEATQATMSHPDLKESLPEGLPDELLEALGRPVIPDRTPAGRAPGRSTRRDRQPPPGVHAGSEPVREAWRAILRAVRQAYAEVAERFFRGEITAVFPDWTLPPPLWRVGWTRRAYV